MKPKNLKQSLKRAKGITLIALVITIIVLLILAGISISLVVGNNGVLSQASNAVITTNESELKEAIELAYLSAQMEKGENYLDGVSADELKTALQQNGVTDVIVEKADELGTLEVVSKQNGNKYEVKDGIVTQVEPEKLYLVDVVNIGDYVDIGIDYENQGSYSWGGDIIDISTLKGWRVLSKNGTGETGTIKLVSAGCPLNMDGAFLEEEYVQRLEDLYINYEKIDYFQSGFLSFDLQSIFTEDKYIDVSKGIHALGWGKVKDNTDYYYSTRYTPINEVEKLYEEITGQTIEDISGNFYVTNNDLKEKAGNKWKESYANLLENGQTYFLGGRSYSYGSTSGLCISSGGYSFSAGHREYQQYGVRPVVSLQSGVQISFNNKGDGLSSSSAYSITK